MSIVRESRMSKLGRLIRRGRKIRHLSATGLSVYPDNAEVALGRENSDTINALLPLGTDIGLLELSEVRDRLKQASIGRGITCTSEATRAVSVDLSSYPEHGKGNRRPTTTLAMRYAAIIGVNFETEMTRTGENDGKTDRSSLDFSLGDQDFELVLRHFWKHLDAEKRRKLIQVAAGLVEENCSGS